MEPTRALVALAATVRGHGAKKRLADEIGEDLPTVSRILNGRRLPTLQLAVKIQHARGIPACWWLERATWQDIDAREAA